MKKLLNVIVLALAVNFLAVVGFVAYLKSEGRIDREKVMAIKALLYPQPATQPDESTTQPADPSTQPTLRLEELLARQTGRNATEQAEFIQQAFDAQMAQLERRRRELIDLQRQVDLAKQQLTADRKVTADQQKSLQAREMEADRLARDKGFQDSLTLYKTMPGKQVKTVFMSLDDALVSRYLQAMEPRTAARIIKEFKSQDETRFIQQVLERIRQTSTAQASAAPAAGSADVAGAGTSALQGAKAIEKEGR